jgi:hypothetical protein
MATKLSAKQETRVFWQVIAGVTLTPVNLSFATYTVGNRILSWENFSNSFIKNKPVMPSEVFDLLVSEYAWNQNKSGKSVLWKFAKGEMYNVVIVDDIQKVEEFKHKDHLLLWQTSQNKYQASFLLDTYVNAETVKKIQRVLIKLYGGDKACIGASHCVKMPGFYNTKYLMSPPYIKLVHIGNNVLYPDEILQYYEEKIKPKEYKPKEEFKSTKIITNIDLSKKKKDWWYFYNLKQDKSAADFSYAKYLMNFGLSDEEIKQILLNESDDIENRKIGHLEDYLDRTVKKARSHFVPFDEEA